MAPKGLEPSVSNVQHVLFWSLHVLPLAIFYMGKKPAPSFWLGTHPLSIGVGMNLADYHLKVWSCLIQWRCLSCRVSVFLQISVTNISKRLFRVPPVISKGNSSYQGLPSIFGKDLCHFPEIQNTGLFPYFFAVLKFLLSQSTRCNVSNYAGSSFRSQE